MQMQNTYNIDYIGDYIGVESCLDLKNSINEDIFACSTKQVEAYEICWKKKREEKKSKKRTYPPPIPLLARTENLSGHMPWVLKRYYTSDGRLILSEEKVKHHEYFRAHRENGRLTLQLVPLDDRVSSVPPGDFVDDDHDHEEQQQEVVEEEQEEEEGEGIMEMQSKDCEKDDDNEVFDDDEEEIMVCEDQRVPSMENHAAKCFNYNNGVRTRSSTFIFGVPVPAIRPIHG